MTKFLWISAGAINGVHGSCLANMIPKYDINISIDFYIHQVHLFICEPTFDCTTIALSDHYTFPHRCLSWRTGELMLCKCKLKLISFKKIVIMGFVIIQLFRERLSEKVHATIPKGIVGGFEFTFLQRNLKEWHLRPWTYVCEC